MAAVVGGCGCGSGLRAQRCCGLVDAALPAAEVQRSLRPLIEALPADEAERERQVLAILELAPVHPVALRMLQQRRAAQGASSASRALLARLVRHYPQDHAARCELSTLHLRAGEPLHALEHARAAVRLLPRSAVSHDVLARALLSCNRARAAELHFLRALELLGRDAPGVLANLAWSLNRQGRLAEARALYQRLDAAGQMLPQTLLNWAETEQADRCFARAEELLARVQAEQPGNEAALLARAALLERAGDLEAALTALAPAQPGAPETVLTRGRLLDQLGQHDAAFASFVAGKEQALKLGARPYAEAEMREAAERMRLFFVERRLANLPRAQVRTDCPQPIFILGFPRSGTTLLEQILCSHAAVVPGDELPLLPDVIAAMPRLLGTPNPYPDALAELWMADGGDGLDVLRDHYLRGARLLGLLERGTGWFTDKMPLNEGELALIGLIFPAAPLLHMIRHPCDVLVSVLSHQMTHGGHMASALDSAAKHYALVAELVAHYRSEMALRYLPVRYEDLVTDPETQVRRILGFIGLPFDPACLRFHENKRHARTPSNPQIARPLYDRARGRWRAYARQLQPVLPILAPAAARLGYDLV